MTFGLPERIELDDVVLRTYTPDDVPTLARAMAESYDHLHPWLSWATPEGITEQACSAFIEAAAAQRVAGTDFNYGIFARGATDDDRRVLGACGLHDRIGPGALEIGYWLHVDATGRGLMTRAAEALTELALNRTGIERVEIHCDEMNHASAAIPRRLGYTLFSVGPSLRSGGAADSGRHLFWAKHADR